MVTNLNENNNQINLMSLLTFRNIVYQFVAQENLYVIRA